MIYTTLHKIQTVEFLLDGHTYEATSQKFKASISTIQQRENIHLSGALWTKPLVRTPTIFDDAAVEQYIKEFPDALLKTMADDFGGSISGAFKACKRNDISLKKKRHFSSNVTSNYAPNSSIN